jgi:hypothetical protein
MKWVAWWEVSVYSERVKCTCEVCSHCRLDLLHRVGQGEKCGLGALDLCRYLMEAALHHRLYHAEAYSGRSYDSDAAFLSHLCGC